MNTYRSRKSYHKYTLGAGATQTKNGYIISVNGSNEPTPFDWFDWYKGFIEVTFNFIKLDNTNYAANDNVIINGSYSLIPRLGLDIPMMFQ